MQIVDLDYLEVTPLSNQLTKLSGDSWNAHDWTNQDGERATLNPGDIIKNKNTGQLFQLPKKQSKVIQYFQQSFEYKMQILQSKEVIQIDEDIYYYLLEAVPPVRMAKGAFLAGEAYTHRGNTPIFASCFQVEKRYFLTFLSVQEFEQDEHTKRYQEHLKNYDLF